ncbi:MAG TPA: prepilin-type N-terminal cleavage/methylation domain-containing protein [Candidatus Ozemobacteraceae bacterium]|nr:prepilin-type N-terminal cleavage/methylation domain-containing protein [Candidatus Ozemobacteraceae bacterium]
MKSMSCKTRSSRRAFSLVEVMISLLLFGIILATGYLFLNRTFVSLERQRQSLDTLHEAREFLMLIERDLREMTKLVSLDTVLRDDLFAEDNALFFTMTIEVPQRIGDGTTTVTWSYEGPSQYKDLPGAQKIIYRQEKGKIKRAIVTKQLDYLKVWGTDGIIFRKRDSGESLDTYQKYLRPHYYHPTNVGSGLSDLAKVRGVEVQLSMNELYDKAGIPIKTRTFVTRIYSRVLNSKFE